MSSKDQLHCRVFPVIRELILAESRQLGRPVSRDDLGPKLKDHPEVTDALRRSYDSKPRQMTFGEYCCNQVDWYSASWTRFTRGDLNARGEEVMRSATHGVRRLKPGKDGRLYRYEPDSAC